MRVIVAARLSRKQADGQQGIGIETQDERGRQWAKREGHEVVDVIPDTKSGTTAPWDRPKLRPWVTDPAQLALYDGIVAYATDRISRGTDEDFSRIETWAADHGKKLIIVNGADGIWYPARSDSDYWQWAATKREAHKEWENITRRSGDAQQRLRGQGWLVGGAPWGFDVAGPKYGRHLVPNDLGREYVPAIFARCEEGWSLPRIAAWLTGQGVQTPGRSTSWNPTTIAAIIRRRAYMGYHEMSGGTVHRCEALVPADVWRKANDALTARAGVKRGHSNPETRPMLSGVLYCSRCGSHMHRMWARGWGGAGKVPYYHCSGQEAPGRKCGTMVRCDLADAAVNRIAARTFKAPVLAARPVPGEDHSAELEEIRYEIQRLGARDLADDAYDAELTRLRAERDRLAALPAVPATVVEEPTGQVYAELWEALSVPERGPWLASKGFRAEADKTMVRLTRPGATAPWGWEDAAYEPIQHLLPPRDLLLPGRGRISAPTVRLPGR